MARTAVVTGASSGIGRAFAELLAAEGYAVVPVARREDRLAALADELHDRWGADVRPIAVDLASPDGPEQVLAAVGDGVDFLVNNAGNSLTGRFDTVAWEVHQQRLALMGISTWRLTHGVLPGMVQRGWGRIVNVSSIAALFTGFPTDVTYNATKGMVIRFSEGIDAEYRRLGVRCTVSLPGPTPTEIFTHPGSSADVAEHPLFRHLQTSTATVARETYAAAMAGKPFIVPGRQFKPLATVLQYAPAPLRRRLSVALCRVMSER
jgi:short-subunit dehydrogenase